MRRTLRLLLAMALLLVVSPASAQDEWARPVQGISEAVFGGQKLGVMLVTPVDDEVTVVVEELVRRQLLASGFAAVVMDDKALGSLADKSDDEIITAAAAYPVDVVVVLRTFPGAEGTNAVIRVESTDRSRARSFRLEPQGPPPAWAASTPVAKPATPTENPTDAARADADARAREQAAKTRMGTFGVAETMRLIEAEHARKVLAFEMHPRSPIVRNPAGEVVPWPKAYESMDQPALAVSYRRRSRVRTIAMAAGAVFGAAGVGMLFVGLANQANCSNGGNCDRSTLLIAGASSLAVGASGIVTGLLIRRHRWDSDEIEELVQSHNRSLE